MKLAYYPVEKLKQEIIAIVGKHLDLSKYRVFFFGSRVAGRATERSDIDVGIEGPRPVPARTWLEIQDEVEGIPTLYKIEIVDFGTVSPRFREVALQHIEPLADR